ITVIIVPSQPLVKPSCTIKKPFQGVIPSSACLRSNIESCRAVIYACGPEWLAPFNCSKCGTSESSKWHHLGGRKKLRLCQSCFPTLPSNATGSHFIFRDDGIQKNHAADVSGCIRNIPFFIGIFSPDFSLFQPIPNDCRLKWREYYKNRRTLDMFQLQRNQDATVETRWAKQFDLQCMWFIFEEPSLAQTHDYKEKGVEEERCTAMSTQIHSTLQRNKL
ncbi:hypothetical protein BDR26DRAFT_865690, partial [Obelidium mucronatum]